VSGALDGVINIWSIQVRNALVVSVYFNKGVFNCAKWKLR
jgi:hypothetical protein